jgi:hypothetical protein
MKRFGLIGVAALGAVLVASVARAETMVVQNIDTRTNLGFLAPPDGVQRWLPPPWVVHPIATGALTGANILVVFGDRLINQDATGKIAGSGTDRFMVLAASARNTQTSEVGLYVLRIYTSDPLAVPGAYKNSVLASMLREQEVRSSDIQPADVRESWELSDFDGGDVDLKLEYQRKTPTRGQRTTRVHGGPDPDFYRIYRLDEGVQVLKSVSSGVDQIEHLEFRVGVPALHGIFDGSEKLIGVTVTHFFIRQVFLP